MTGEKRSLLGNNHEVEVTRIDNDSAGGDYRAFNSMINLLNAGGGLQLEQDQVALSVYFKKEINPKYRKFETLGDKLNYLFENEYYERKHFDNYDFNFIKSLYKKAYSYNFRFGTFMAALKFYSMYGLKSFDGNEYLESFEDRVVANAIFLGGGDEKLAQQIVEEMITRRYQPATPTFSNAGKAQRGSYTSCYLLNVDDNIESINRSITDSMHLSKRGGGVALNISNLRESGAPIKKVTGQSSGVVPVMKLYEDAFKYANQQGVRQGAGAAYLSVHHPDILQFLDTKKENADEAIRIKTLSIGVIIPDVTYHLSKNNQADTTPENKGNTMALFSPYDIKKVYGLDFNEVDITKMYDELVANDAIKKTWINPRNLFGQIAKMQFESGYPYIMNVDSANRAHNNAGKITMSNLCVTGDTEILTSKGYRTAKSLYDSQEDFNVVVDERARTMDLSNLGTSVQKSSKMFKTAENADVYRVVTSEGFEIKATEWHKFYVERSGELIKIPLAELEIGDKLLIGDSTYGDNDGTIENRVDNATATITEIEHAGVEDVYDPTVDNGHSVIYNGIATGQCSEILQASNPSTFNADNSFKEVGRDISCNLGSLNVDNTFNSQNFSLTVETAMRALTTVTNELDEDIECSPSVQKGNRDNHAVGLGQMNLHGFLAHNFIEYDSEEAIDFTRMYFYSTLYQVLKASNKIAMETGKTYWNFKDSKYASGEFFDKYTENELPDFRTDKVRGLFASSTVHVPTRQDWLELKDSVARHGLYHAYMQAIAPTGSISYVNEATSSIHPIVAPIEARKDGMSGRVFVPMPHLNDDTVGYYRTAYMIDNKAIIDIYAAAQEFVDQGMSLTLFYSNENTTRDLIRTYIYAWTKGIKTLYYARIQTKSLEGTEVEDANALCESCMV